MDTEDRQLVVDTIKELRKLGRSLHRTGATLVVLGVTVAVAASFDTFTSDVVAGGATGLIMVIGLNMFVRAGSLLKIIEDAAMKALTTPRRDA